MAAQTAGINVISMKYQAILISGLVGGLAGAHLSLGYSTMFTENMTSNRGFMGVAAMYFGHANPALTAVGCLVFGVADSVGARLQAYGLPSQFVLLMPYVVTIVVLSISMISKKVATDRKKSSLNVVKQEAGLMKKLKNVLNEHKEEYIKYLSELVSIDTQDLGHGIDGGREEKGQEYLIKLLEKMGADKIEKDALEEETIKKCLQLYNEGNLGHNYDHRYNVYATFAGKGGKSIMFNGHMDTMPPGDLSKWITKPHCPDIRDNRMYGLGTADMKGGLMASVLAIKLLKDAGIELPGDVIITSVCDEEGGGNGSMLAAMNGKKADGVVVCEGTSDELIVAHMGFVFFDVKIEGKANHSGAKWLGVSAIEKAIKLIRGLEELEHGWLMEYKHPLLPAPSLNVGVIEGGTAGSTVAGECEFKVCVHYLPEIMSYEKVVSEFTDTIEGIANGDKWLKDHKPEISVYQAGGAFEMERTHPFVEAFAEGYKQAKGRTPNIVGSPSGCDSRIWKNVAKCPTIQFGPGNLEQCHSVNEYLDMDAYLESILIYAELILAWGKNK